MKIICQDIYYFLYLNFIVYLVILVILTYILLMTNLEENLNQIINDATSGREKLLDLVNSIIKQNDTAALKNVFTILLNNSAAQANQGYIAVPSLDPAFNYIKGLESEKDKLSLYYPILSYIVAFESLRVKYLAEKDEFAQLCEKYGKYYELSQYYLRRHEKNRLDYQACNQNEKFDYILAIADALASSGDVSRVRTWSLEAKNNFHIKSASKQQITKYFKFKVTYNLLFNSYNFVSDAYFSLYNQDKEAPESLEYLRKAAVYAILSNESNKYFLISRLLNEEKMKKLPIRNLLERFGNESIITAAELPEIKKQLYDSSSNMTDEQFSEIITKIILNQNIRAIAKYFTSISFDRISQIAGENVETILDHLQRLISTRTVKSLIDQPSQMIYFKSFQTEEERKDASISSFCRKLQQFTSGISE